MLQKIQEPTGDVGKVTEVEEAMDETEYLLSSEANATRLRESIAQLEAGTVKTIQLSL